MLSDRVATTTLPESSLVGATLSDKILQVRAMDRFCLLALVALCSCSRPEEHAQTQWTTSNIVGLNMRLVDRKRIESFSFASNGYVVVSFGEKNGGVTAPLWRWRISGDRLEIYDEVETNKNYHEFRLVSLDSSFVVARRKSGQVARFEVVKNEP